MFKNGLLKLLTGLGIALNTVTVYASTPTYPTTNATNLNIIIPSLKTGFTFNVAALFLKPGASSFRAAWDCLRASS